MIEIEIRLEYDDSIDGKLSDDDWNNIIDVLSQYGTVTYTSEREDK